VLLLLVQPVLKDLGNLKSEVHILYNLMYL